MKKLLFVLFTFLIWLDCFSQAGFYNFGTFAVYPNPSSGSIRLDLNEDLAFGITIQSLDSTLKMEVENYRGGEEIDTSLLKPGEYVLSIWYEGQVLDQQRIILSK